MEQMPLSFPPIEEREEPVVKAIRPELRLVPKPSPEDDVITRAVKSLIRFHDLGIDDWPADWREPQL